LIKTILLHVIANISGNDNDMAVSIIPKYYSMGETHFEKTGTSYSGGVDYLMILRGLPA
jgi:hypothetical protein